MKHAKRLVPRQAPPAQLSPNLIPESEFGAMRRLTMQSLRLHRRQGMRREVNGAIVGTDRYGFTWTKLGTAVFYFRDGTARRLEQLGQKAERVR